MSLHIIRFKNKCFKDNGYVHTVTFLHGFVLFHNPKGIPIYFQTIENDAKTLPCAHSQRKIGWYNFSYWRCATNLDGFNKQRVFRHIV